MPSRKDVPIDIPSVVCENVHNWFFKKKILANYFSTWNLQNLTS